MEIEVGKVIGGKYRLTRLLGKGGMGEVWIARHSTLEQDVAIKLMTRYADDAEGEADETSLARFQLEARVAASLSKRTRNVVAVTDRGYDEGNPYLVMDLLDGEGLDRLLDRDRVLQPDRAAAIVSQVARGLAAAHAEGVVHRDLKPANVFLTKDEEGRELVKLLDFGIARLERRREERLTPHLTEYGCVLGTPDYMSPEQARGQADVDHHCDLWALSVVAYEALTGAMPFAGNTPEDTIVRICTETPKSVREHRPSLPGALDSFFDRAFSRSVSARFSSAEELASVFARAVAGERELKLPMTTSPRKIAIFVVAAVALLSVVGLVVGFTRHDRREATATHAIASATTANTIPPPPTEATTAAPVTSPIAPSATVRTPVATAVPTAKHPIPSGPTATTATSATASATATATPAASATPTKPTPTPSTPAPPAAPVDKGAIL